MSELKLIIRKSSLSDVSIVVPPSKSYTHRAIIAAALSQGKTIIKNPLISDDTNATIDTLRKLGAKINNTKDGLEVDGTRNYTLVDFEQAPRIILECKESGTTLRILTPICALIGGEITLTGRQSLLKRPTKELVNALKAIGISIQDNDGFPPVKIFGHLQGGKTIKIMGDVSSQFISGLLFALPLAEKDSEIQITTEVESLSYIKMTLNTLEKFGIKIKVSEDYKNYKMVGSQQYKSHGEYTVEGDYSSAAFLLAAGALAGPQVQINSLNASSKQGDSAIIKILEKMGAEISISKDSVIVKKSELKATNIDVQDTPDLVPILAVLATQAKGKTKIINAGRLRIKESDRLATITQELRKMGAKIVENKDSLEINGPTKLHGAVIDPHNDHRIAMACTIAGLIAEGETIISNPEVVKKSYPDFFYHMRKLGATILSETAPIGEKFKIQLYGGSHEKLIGIKINGVPKGTEIAIEKIREELNKRKPFGNLTTPRREEDELKIINGIKNGKTTGEEIIIEIENKDVNSKPYELTRFNPRPGHGDYTTYIKYGGIFDFRGGGFLSARMTTCTVIAGSIAKQILAKYGIRVAAYVKQIGKISMGNVPNLEEVLEKTFKSEVRCPDLQISEKMKQEIETARADGDSVGGIIECQVHGLPIGIGEPIFNAIDSVLAHYLFSIPAVKGVEFGSGFSSSVKRGSENNDPFAVQEGKIITITNNSGGILGGITNGMPLICKVAIKPASSIAKDQKTVDVQKQTNESIKVLGRHDPCVAIRAPIIVETTVAIAILDLMLVGEFNER